MTLAACENFTAPEVLACERFTIAKLRSPSTYKRIDSFSYRGEDGKQHVSVEYDAANAYGTPVRDKQFCLFPIKNGDVVVDGVIDHDAVLREDADRLVKEVDSTVAAALNNQQDTGENTIDGQTVHQQGDNWVDDNGRVISAVGD